MALRTLSDPTPIPPEGAITVSVARTLTHVYPHPDMLTYHRQRSEAIHELTDQPDVTVLDWGDTDSDTPREIVDVILQLGPEAIQAVATVLAAWIVARTGRESGRRDRAVRGIVITAADGSRVELSPRKPVSRKEATEIVSSFLRSRASAGQREAN